MTGFRFLPPAEAELLQEIAYYAAIRHDLGSRFEQAVVDAVRALVAHPERGASRSKGTRRWLVKGFPFCVIYRAAPEDEVLIAAVAHLRRQPDYWADRLK